MTDEPEASIRRQPPIPQPAHARHRREALPGQLPKSPEDDSSAPEGLRKILASASYREADEDVAFLQSPETRGVRLQLDFLKAETLLQAHCVVHTIVVFGSTRILEPQAARRNVNVRRCALAGCGDAESQGRLAVAERIAEKSVYYETARRFGQIVGVEGAKGSGGRIMIMTGGGPGIMEAANRGAHDVGAPSIGLNITLPQDQFPNPYVTPELCFRFHYFATRKLHFLLRARALVAFPGGYGTMDELFELLSLAQTRKIAPVPVVLVGRAFWRRAFDPEFLVDEGVIDPEDRDLFWYCESAEEAWRAIVSWYEAAGRPLLAAEDGS